MSYLTEDKLRTILEDEMKGLATKDGLFALKSYVDERFDAFEEKMFTKEDFDRLMIVVDAMAKDTKEAYRGHLLFEGQLVELDDQVHNHEKRIKILEAK